MLLLAGCASVARLPFTETDITAASPAIRYDFRDAGDATRFREALRTAAGAPADGTFDLLALSGGGSEGAYGAGLLVGWGGSGKRPVFEVVTGVSIGALMAPFAFIGAAGDEQLTRAFTDGRASRVLEPRWAMSIYGPGLFRQRPLRALVEAAITPEVLAGVAHGQAEGRRLYVATTSLDTQGQVIWDMGALAASGQPDARARFIDILVASSSIPGVFEPVFITLERDGRAVRELHADGRTTSNVFVVPERMMLSRDIFGPTPTPDASPPRRLWIVMNGRPEPAFSVAPYAALSIAGRSLDAMMKASTRMTLIAAAQFARLNSMTIAIAMAPPGAVETSLDFSQPRMQALYERGRDHGLAGDGWAVSATTD
ncbi:patatin family protein [soil metagenome]